MIKYSLLNILAGLLLTPLSMNAQSLPAYQLFKKNGTPAEYSEVVADALKAEVVFFGELHNNPICHWLQLELLKSLEAGLPAGNLALGTEMFEADVQLVINEYWAGQIKTSHFKDNSRPWPNYDTDYQPMLEWAKGKNIPMIATNIPRRYASLVARNGIESLDNLSKDAKKLMVPLKKYELDQSLPGYKALLDMMGASGHGGISFVHAQAIKDATMAYFIDQNRPKNGVFYHLNGDYHSKNDEGIIWYLRNFDPKVKTLVISSVEQEQVNQLDEEHLDRADYILVIPASMTKTY